MPRISLIAAGLLTFARFRHSDHIPPLAYDVALRAGGRRGIGLLSGMVGIGGGLFLAPLLAFTQQGRAKEVAALSALFMLVNSIGGGSQLVKIM